jgi:Mn-containing catalase
MFYHDKNLQYTARVDEPSPQFVKMLRQAIGGVTQTQQPPEISGQFNVKF